MGFLHGVAMTSTVVGIVTSLLLRHYDAAVWAFIALIWIADSALDEHLAREATK